MLCTMCCVAPVRQWPEALVSRCVAFEPSPAHLAAPTAKLQDLMILPAGGRVCGLMGGGLQVGCVYVLP